MLCCAFEVIVMVSYTLYFGLFCFPPLKCVMILPYCLLLHSVCQLPCLLPRLPWQPMYPFLMPLPDTLSITRQPILSIWKLLFRASRDWLRGPPQDIPYWSSKGVLLFFSTPPCTSIGWWQAPPLFPPSFKNPCQPFPSVFGNLVSPGFVVLQ